MVGFAQRIDALLPQTQCTRCGYPSCLAYAEAVAAGDADINRCPPGGDETVLALAALTGRSPRTLDQACGEHGPRRVARVDESWCIGCTLCIQACPVDAILGGPRRMHTVVEALCTRCELCLTPCPVDCIHMAPATTGPMTPAQWLSERAAQMRQRHLARAARLRAVKAKRVEERRQRRHGASSRKAVIARAVARTRARRAGIPQ